VQYNNNVHNHKQYMIPELGMDIQKKYGIFPCGLSMINKPGDHCSCQSNLSMLNDTVYTYPNNLSGALDLIKKAVLVEAEDRNLYEFLLSIAPTKEEKKIIRSIIEDEIEHFGLFRQIYYELTGQMLPVPHENKIKKPASYREGIKKALIGEQDTTYKYGKILFAMVNRMHMMKVIKIITDEIRHGTLLNYIYIRTRCR
jgi:rubrerythrin